MIDPKIRAIYYYVFNIFSDVYDFYLYDREAYITAIDVSCMPSRDIISELLKKLVRNN